jgi:hypothetical protein
VNIPLGTRVRVDGWHEGVVVAFCAMGGQVVQYQVAFTDQASTDVSAHRVQPLEHTPDLGAERA